MAKIIHGLVAAAVSASAVYLSAGAANAQPITARLRVQGVVRTICDVEFNGSAVAVSSNRVDLGQMLQSCNNSEGYRIVVQHPSGLTNASIEIDGTAVPLSSGNETVIVDANEPDYRISAASLNAPNATQLATLSFRIEPKGGVF